ncbi:helix-turn-helix transcriptional regulator [Lacrimispora sp.]|uniref:helix-turn-helix transcriptional regulator n=1 Tax=Lacrimispora sp. TaxID=2719234 RepID=UPI0028AC2ECA|nr:AraC family transcriptional regulator [Lacrimispora sp.]
MPDFRTQLAEEYARFPLTIQKAASFTKSPGQIPASYETTRAAFIFPISGKANISFDSHAFTAIPGKVIHGCPGKRLTFYVEGAEPFCHINLYYDPYDYQNKGTDFIHSAYELDILNQIEVTSCLKELLRLSHCHDIRSRFRMNFTTQQLFDALFCSKLSKQEAEELNFINEAALYIRDHYTEPLTLPQIAGHFQKKSQNFSYIFYKVMGIRPVDYLIEYRLETAAGLLNENGYSVRQAAIAVGYKDEFYFSRLFKKHMGITPSKIKSRIVTERKES